MLKHRKISVTGLGYVGLTLAAAFGKKENVIGFDISKRRIAELKKGYDKNGELSSNELTNKKIHYTTNPHELKKANFHIITVLTPVDEDNRPDLSILLAASETVGKELKKGDIVVYESTVYPGATEEKCIPALERASHLICGKDFAVGYSPERINPADKVHTFATIPKIVSGINKKALNTIASVYKKVVKAGVFPVSTIRIAEATKIVENTQRDLNISLINEIAVILHSFGMDSTEVLAAAKTKWNFLPFSPGLVGGHCIGVNSYYLTYKAEEAGYHPDVILAGRRINNYMAKFLAENTVKQLIHQGVQIKGARIAVLGLTYKENFPDLHDSRVIDTIKELKEYDTQVLVHDPIADPAQAKQLYDIDLVSWENLVDVDAVLLMVGHKQYSELDGKKLKKILRKRGLIMDVKGILDAEKFNEKGIVLWKL